MSNSHAVLEWSSRILEWLSGSAGILIAISVVLILTASAFYIGAFIEAYLEVKNKPREKMGWCNKHGMIRQSHMLDLGYTQVCPRCYKAALDQGNKS